MTSRWIWVFGEADALRWVIDRQTMAFADHATGRIRPMASGDTAALYVTRGAHHNPTRDVARLAGSATVLGAPGSSDEPVDITGRQFAYTCPIRIDVLHGLRAGPPITDLIERLEFIRKPAAWGAYFRMSPIRASEADWQTLSNAISSWKQPGD